MIEQGLARGTSLRSIAFHFKTTHTTLRRHRQCIASELEGLRNAAKIERASDVNKEVERGFSMTHKLLDACDEWLRDPDDPSRYNIGPRAEEIMVTFTERTPSGKEKRKKALLSELIEKIENDDRKVLKVRIRHADPRTLFLKAVGALQRQIVILAHLTGAFKRKPEKPSEIERKRQHYNRLIEGAINSMKVKYDITTNRSQVIARCVFYGDDEILEFVALTPAEQAEMDRELRMLRGEPERLYS